MVLSVREIYDLADAVAPSAEDRTFQAVMERATAALASRAELPSFENWRKAYSLDPASYDADMIGFWREQG